MIGGPREGNEVVSTGDLGRVPPHTSSIVVDPRETTDRVVSIEVVQVTERTAVAAAQWRGRGNEKAADQAAVEAMWRELNRLPIAGRVVVGERDEAPMLFIGEQVGIGAGPKVDIAVQPLEGKTLCAKALPGAITTMAIIEDGGLLNVPDVYMDKIAIGPGYPPGVVDLDAKPEHNIHKLAMAKGVKPHEITALILDRPRHAELIGAVRRTGASVQLISDGDVAGVIHATDPETTGVDIYLGIGGAPEGVLAAAALRCIGGQFQARLILDNDSKRAKARRLGIRDYKKKYVLDEMVNGDCVFAATGIVSGSMLRGVRFGKGLIETETVVMRSVTGTIRWIRAEHRLFDKFQME
jgi:fructose-1,6-bisphosphatase II / sedoheptulose-1,7-bisphosphatase